MSILQARVYDLKKLTPLDRSAYGLRILTTRRWIQGVSKYDLDIWLPDAAPSLQLLCEYRAGYIAGDAFLARYEQEQYQQCSCRVVRYEDGKRIAEHLVEPLSPIAYLKHIETIYGTLTVMCWEKEPATCHRHRLWRLLQQ